LYLLYNLHKYRHALHRWDASEADATGFIAATQVRLLVLTLALFWRSFPLKPRFNLTLPEGRTEQFLLYFEEVLQNKKIESTRSCILLISPAFASLHQLRRLFAASCCTVMFLSPCGELLPHGWTYGQQSLATRLCGKGAFVLCGALLPKHIGHVRA
jgi:hypothetical protein